jgi:hypothetical protein
MKTSVTSSWGLGHPLPPLLLSMATLVRLIIFKCENFVIFYVTGLQYDILVQLGDHELASGD